MLPMSNKLQWIKLYHHDYSNDAALSLCCLSAQGLWMRLMCIAAQSRRYGHVLIGGKKPTIEQIAALVREEPNTIKQLIDELIQRGVATKTRGGVLTCKRMIKDYRVISHYIEMGQRGGNPALLRKPLTQGDNGVVNQESEGVQSTDSPPVGPHTVGATPDGPSPRAKGSNPRANGTNPRQRQSRNAMVDIIRDDMENQHETQPTRPKVVPITRRPHRRLHDT